MVLENKKKLFSKIFLKKLRLGHAKRFFWKIWAWAKQKRSCNDVFFGWEIFVVVKQKKKAKHLTEHQKKNKKQIKP